MGGLQARGEGGRLDRLMRYLDADPGNLTLIADAAIAAVDEGALEQAAQLLSRYEASSPLSPPLRNLRGILAIKRKQFADAVTIFQSLIAEAPNEPSLKFNLAWARAMLADFEGAAQIIDHDTAISAPHAAALKVRALHHQQQVEEAIAFGEALASEGFEDPELMGALAIAAIDIDDYERARSYAAQAADQPEGLTALGMVLLHEHDAQAALVAFDRALEIAPDQAQAAIGKGLVLLNESEPAQAAEWLDRGAEIFVDHAGTWVASGWAHFAAGELAASRDRFERAVASDEAYAEAHAGLALLDLVQNDVDSARRRVELALTLDPDCGEAQACASIMNLAGGKAQAKDFQALVSRAGVGESGKALAQALAGLGRPKSPGR